MLLLQSDILFFENAIAKGDFSEEAQKLSLNLHGDPCMVGGTVKLRERPISLFDRPLERIKFDQERFGRWDSFLLTRQNKDSFDSTPQRGLRAFLADGPQPCALAAAYLIHRLIQMAGDMEPTPFPVLVLDGQES